MSSKATSWQKEPWDVKPNGILTQANGHGAILLYDYEHCSGWAVLAKNNAIRIAACVNGCKGLRKPEKEIERWKKMEASIAAFLAAAEGSTDARRSLEDLKALHPRKWPHRGEPENHEEHPSDPA